MAWTIEYFERENTLQPAEIFEDELDRVYPKISGKLIAIIEQLGQYGYRLGGGYIEKCREYVGMWEIRVIHGSTLARELFGFDGERVVLLHGYIKRVGEPASEGDLRKAFGYWEEYQRTRHVSPLQEESDESI
jgi:hypothetical protein